MAKSDRKLSLVGGIVGGIAGGVCGFFIRGMLNSPEAIGFANIPDQLIKLVLWTLAGATIFAFLGVILGRVAFRR